jgi:ABC-type transport system involved in multi-copper enzyme maturation permease subunit
VRRFGTLVIARLTFKEAARRRILLAALLLGIVFLTVYGLGIHFIRDDMVKRGEHLQRVVAVPIYNFLALSGLYVVSFLTLALTVLTSVDTLSGEIDSGSIQALAAKPIRRWEILIGKWLGFVAMLTLYLLLMAGGVVVLTRAVLDYNVPNSLRGLALMWINEVLLLNVTLLGGTRLSTLANGVLAFSAYGVAFIAGWIEQIGAFLGNQTTVVIGILSSLLMPSEALWKRAAFEMRTALVDAVPPNPFMSSLSVPSVAMVVYAVFYAAIALTLAIWSFRRRDL